MSFFFTRTLALNKIQGFWINPFLCVCVFFKFFPHPTVFEKKNEIFIWFLFTSWSVILFHQNFSEDQNSGFYQKTLNFLLNFLFWIISNILECHSYSPEFQLGPKFRGLYVYIFFHHSFFNVLECHSLFTRILGASVPKFRGCNNYTLASLVSLPAERLMTV